MSETTSVDETGIEIKNLRQALAYITKKAGGGFMVRKLYTGNPDFKGKAVGVVWQFGGQKFYVTLKRGWLGSYSKLYRKEKRTIGQTMNRDVLLQAVEDNAICLIVFPNGVVYGLDASEWLKYGQEHKTSRIPSTEKTYEVSVPINLMCRQVWLSPPYKR